MTLRMICPCAHVVSVRDLSLLLRTKCLIIRRPLFLPKRPAHPAVTIQQIALSLHTGANPMFHPIRSNNTLRRRTKTYTNELVLPRIQVVMRE